MPIDGDPRSQLKGMIAIRETLERRRGSLWTALAVVLVAGAVMWMHGSDQGHMPQEHGGGEMAMAVCLAILSSGSLAAIWRLGRHMLRVALRPPRRIAGARNAFKTLVEPLGRPPPRAGPADLQVFLR